MELEQARVIKHEELEQRIVSSQVLKKAYERCVEYNGKYWANSIFNYVYKSEMDDQHIIQRVSEIANRRCAEIVKKCGGTKVVKQKYSF